MVDWYAVSFVYASQARLAVLMCLSKSDFTPRELAIATGRSRTRIRQVLNALSARGLVKCVVKGKTLETCRITNKGRATLQNVLKII